MISLTLEILNFYNEEMEIPIISKRKGAEDEY